MFFKTDLFKQLEPKILAKMENTDSEVMWTGQGKRKFTGEVKEYQGYLYFGEEDP